MFGGALAFAVPAVSLADPVGWHEGEDRLERHLLPGKAPVDYRQTLQDLGYTITATNFNTPDYVEYEVVKGDRTYEVPIDVDVASLMGAKKGSLHRSKKQESQQDQMAQRDARK